MPIGGVVRRRVVLVVVEVPARDVVREPVVVVVEPPVRRASRRSDPSVGDLAVPERDDQVLGIDQAIAVRVLHALIARVVIRVDHAVGDEVVGAVFVAARVLGPRQLAGVDEHLVRQVADIRVVPVDPALDVREHDVGLPGRERAPGLVDRHAGRVLGVVRKGSTPRHERIEVVLLAVHRLSQAARRISKLDRVVAGVVGSREREPSGECGRGGTGQRRCGDDTDRPAAQPPPLEHAPA
jgi:hypothetical protein